MNSIRGTPKSVRNNLRLVVLEPGASKLDVGQLFELEDGAVLGRSEAADIAVSDAAVSAKHARLKRVGGAWVLADLGSTNGTRLNDAPVGGNISLTAGDVITLGTVKLQVVATGRPAARY